MLKLSVEEQAVNAALSRLAAASADLTPAMAGIAAELLSLTEGAFLAEGPGWEPLAESTRKTRARQGKWPGPILQVSNALARSVTTDFGPDFAEIGTNVVYAAIQQLGGEAGRRSRRVTLPARPYLPVTAEGALSEPATVAIVELIEEHLAGALGR